MDFKFYFSLFLRRIHWFLLFFVIGSAVGLTLARILPTVYTAQAQLLVQSEEIPANLAQSTVQTEATEQLQIIQQRILTRNTLIDMANRLEIYGAPGSPERLKMSADDVVADLRGRIGFYVTGGAGPRGRGPAQAVQVWVSFEDESAQMSAAVANEVVTLILREDEAMRTTVARQTLEFFEQEVRRLDKELSERGSAILEFKEANQDALPDSLDFRRSQQAANQERLLTLEREEALLKDQRARMVRLHESLADAQGALPDAQLTAEQRQLRTLKAQLATQLITLSAEHPTIKTLQGQVDALQKIVDAQIAASAGVNAQGQPYSAYQIQLADLDGKLEYNLAQQEQVKARLEELRISIEATPGNAIALGVLQRDYDNTNAQYNQAVRNKAEAETGDIIEALRKGQRIEVVEQAVVPASPTRPNRLLIAGGGVGAGFAIGLAVIVLLEILNSGIRRPVDLTKGLGITPLATLPYMRTKSEAWGRRLVMLGVLGALLVGIPLALWAVHTYYMPLDLLIDNVLKKLGVSSILGALPPLTVPA
ncbi:MAG: lipopolysaccharide biosynthesis protein [Roseivivax sp.]|nr:lipopolysaccharide biosynthesis protein [Roseivivax sp.]